MQLFWGSYSFPTNQAACTMRLTDIRGDNRRELRRVMSVNVRATLDGSTQAELTLAERLCRAALSRPYLDLVLKQDNGSPSGIQLINQTSLSGVRIVDGPHFPEALTPEYVNSRTVEFTAEAEYVVAGSENAIISWEESVSVMGNGGPDYVMRFPINAGGIPQEVSPTSSIITTQRGRAVCHTKEPPLPRPMFPMTMTRYSFPMNKNCGYEYGSPKAIGRGWVEYPLTWQYQWHSTKILKGKPNRPPLF